MTKRIGVLPVSLIILIIGLCNALSEEVLYPNTADYFLKNELSYLNTGVTTNVEEGISEIPQDSSNPIDLTLTFFRFNTVDYASHKQGGLLYAAFPKEESSAVYTHFDKFPERTRSLAGVLKRTRGGNTLYLECSMAGQLNGGENTLLQHSGNSEELSIGEDVARSVVSSTVVIRTDCGGGSGFVIEDAEKIFIITNQHVLLGTDKSKVEILTTDGKQLVPISLQIVPELDLARVEVEHAPTPLFLEDSALIDQVVATVGNSLDAGVITLNSGRVRGIGGADIEIDCEVVPGQSGGPLINLSGNVIGVTTYSLRKQSNSHAKGTRYDGMRFFAIRLYEDTNWTQVASWQDYSRTGEVILRAQEIFDHAIEICASMDLSPRADFIYKGLDKNILEAVRFHNRFAQKMTRMDGAIADARDLKRNNALLASDFRGVYRALIKASLEQETALRRLIGSDQEKSYPWLNEQADQLARMFSALSESLEAQANARPNFLTW